MNALFHEFGRGNLSRLPIHKNPGLEIVYLDHGHLAWQCEGKTEVVRPGSIYFTLPWQEHGSIFEFEPGHHWSFVVIRLTGAAKVGSRSVAFPSALGFDRKTTGRIRQLLTESSLHARQATSFFRSLMFALIDELENPGPFHQPRVVHLTAQVILELASILSGSARPTECADARRISALLTELERTCDHLWTLEEMASRIGLKHTQFTERFRQYTGDSPLRHLNRLRVKKARQLLREGRKSITEIAFDCGFASSQHFAKVFRQFTGVAARAYREKALPPIILPRQTPSEARRQSPTMRKIGSNHR